MKPNRNKRRNDRTDMNKKPSQRPPMKKHNPKILDDEISKPKKVPNGDQTPIKVSTPHPKTPKLVTPNRKRSRNPSSLDKPKNIVPQDSTPKPVTPNMVQERTKHSRKCKRSLNFDYYQQEKESHDVSESYDNSNTTTFIPTLKVYQRRFRENQCLQSSKKMGPDFPVIFKKKRAKRKMATSFENWWYIVKDAKRNTKTSHRKQVKTTTKRVRIRVNKSKKRKLATHKKKSVTDLSVIAATTPYESETHQLQEDLSTLDIEEIVKDLISKMENLEIISEIEEGEKTKKIKEEWWEKQREVFRGRVDSFIAKMHLIQGNRRFSPWKGSVVDSVVGAFLTQNVSDHLSSSAFMSLAARFPVGKEVVDHGEVKPSQESVKCNTKVDEGFSMNNETEHLNHSDSKFILDQESTPEEEPRIVDSEITTEQKSVNNHQILLEIAKEKSRIEKDQQGTKIDWEKFRKSYCKNQENGSNVKKMDAVDWDAVSRATAEEIAETIVERGMSNRLAVRIKSFLARLVKDHGAIDLEWLRDVPPDKAKEFLMSIRGIGLKSVECIRLLTLHHLAFPVDTNVGRVATRLGWVPLQPLPEEVQIHLLNSYPMVNSIQEYLFPRLCTLDQKTLYELHYQLITFGKVFCTKINPNCNACPMRAECRHYASEFASGRLALPGSNEQNHGTSPPSSSVNLQLESSSSSYDLQYLEPIVEVPQSPEPDLEEALPDIEDLFCESDDEIPIIRLNTQEFRETLKDTTSLPKDKALVAFTTQTASIRTMKFVAKLRTLHLVYELPDFHPILVGFDEREHDDPSPYLLAVWIQGEASNSLEYTENQACNSSDEQETVKGTILVPCRTATRGKFPLNGTYFQVNEVFADDETSENPIDVPRCQIWNLSRRGLGCGTSATSIFKALSVSDIQRCFLKGSICVRGFNRKTRQPQSLHRRFHISTTAVAADSKKLGKK